MKTAISIPDPLFESVDALAKRLGVSRSALYARALEAFLADQRKGAITRRLDAVYNREPAYAKLESEVERMQAITLARSGEW
jgi:metal-responsive CopG/Arc/MetJ family transcriptional regulator